MGTTTKTLIRYHNTLIKYSLIKKIIKQKSSSGGYDHNLYQIVLLDKENILYPPAEKLPEEKEEIISGIAEKFSFQDNPKKVIIDNKKSLKTERIKEELKKLNLDKKSINKIISNYSLEDIEEKIDLLQIKRNVINPAGWLITALQANYLNPESSKEEKYEEEEEITEIEKIKSENIITNHRGTLPEEKEKEERKRLSREEELKWIRQIRYDILK